MKEIGPKEEAPQEKIGRGRGAWLERETQQEGGRP